MCVVAIIIGCEEMHGACCTRHQFARSTHGCARPFGPSKGHQVLVYSTLTATLLATFLCAECPCVCLVRHPLEPRPCLATCLAEDILVVGKKVLDISRIVLRLHFVLAATCARDQLADLAAVCATSELGLRLPPSAACTKFSTLASIAALGFVSLAILHRRCIVIMQWPPKLAMLTYEASWIINAWCVC